MKYKPLTMKKELMTTTERFYLLIRELCQLISYIPFKIGNWATKKLNESYYKLPVKDKE